MLYNVVGVSAIYQRESEVHIYICFCILIHIHVYISFSHAMPLGCHRVPGWLTVLHSSFPLVIYFSHDGVYMLILLPQSVFPSPAVSTGPFSTSVSPFLLHKQVHQYCFSRFHTYALIYDICCF